MQTTDKIKTAIFSVVATILGMIGGQKEKGARRFGIAGLALLMTIGEWSWRNIALVGLIPTLCMGYGVNSWLMGKIGLEWLVRAVYSTLLSLPFIAYGWRRWLIALVALQVAFAIRAGGFYIEWLQCDFLYEDVARYGTLALLISYNIFRRR